MAVHIRLSRAGAKKRPFYRIVVTDHRSPRGGRFLETIGTYDPLRQPEQIALDRERFSFWRSKGALPSDTVKQLITRHVRDTAATAAAAPAAGN
jgi:small subunit ribosomal protein S16